MDISYFVDNLNDVENPEHLKIMTRLRTQPCPYQSESGACEVYFTTKKPDASLHDCFYYHNESEKRRNPIIDGKKELYRPALCTYHAETHGSCQFGDACKFCHGHQELLFHPSIYKTQLCKFNDTTCPSGKYCSYAHGHEDLRNRSTVESRDVKKGKQNPMSFPHNPINPCYYPSPINSRPYSYSQPQSPYVGVRQMYFPKSPPPFLYHQYRDQYHDQYSDPYREQYRDHYRDQCAIEEMQYGPQILSVHTPSYTPIAVTPSSYTPTDHHSPIVVAQQMYYPYYPVVKQLSREHSIQHMSHPQLPFRQTTFYSPHHEMNNNRMANEFNDITSSMQQLSFQKPSGNASKTII